MHSVEIIADQGRLRIEVEHGITVMEALNQAGVTIPAPCGGRCFCGKCRVRLSGEAGALDPAERSFLTEQELSAGWRLACAAHVLGDLSVTVTQEQQAAILSSGAGEEQVPVNPSVTLRPVEVAQPSLNDQRSDAERLMSALQLSGAEMPLSLLSKLPDALRSGQALKVAVFEEGEGAKLLDIGALTVRCGVAVDIGTTTMVAYLMDLNTGKQLDVASALNPQRPYGGDVISRTDYTIAHQDGLAKMGGLVCQEILRLVREMCARQQVALESVYHLVAVGNTIMMHLFARLTPRHIAVLPFIPAYSRGFALPARELQMDLANCMVTVSPCVAGYIGADTIAAVLASGMDQQQEIALLIDIGTNGEIVLGNRERMLCCSAAAGPAFEGAHIRCGTGGVAGAVDSVKIADGQVTVTTIAGQAPLGICGSGLVDAVSAMKDAEIMDMTGRIDEDELPEAYERYLFELDGKPAFSLTGQGAQGVYIAQQDLREVQLAKGAIAAGVQVLMKELGIGFADIGKLYLAGGFGNYIDQHSACNIGLLPAELEERIVPIGNGAGAGAKRMVLSKGELMRAEGARRQMEYIELSARPDFQELFVDNMLFE